ncbi:MULTISPECIES: lantibiotic dehydratase [unclassified Streptomyces]|uniref:lantibiotic dehydratase n=1 Tax=unclassified Streptomyces TaxID=2593676 RepID=UPI00365B05C1
MAARLYRHAGVLLVRATTHPGEGVPVVDVDLSGPGGVRRGTAWLGAVWGHPQARKALESASPVLAAQTAVVLATAYPGLREVRRLVHSTAGYLLRWEGRATPFGHFAGIAPARINPAPQADWGHGHRAVERPDAGWLGALADQLATDPEVVQRLRVAVHPAAVVRGHRVVAPGRTPAKGLAPLEVSVAAAGPLRTVLDAARSPLPFSDLAKVVGSDFPDAPTEAVHSLLAGLLEHGVLLSALDSTAAAPHTAPHAAAGGPAKVWPDTVMDARIAVPEGVPAEVEAAAAALLRLSPYPFGKPLWKDFHKRFRQSYGVGAVVPVADAVGDGGLGLPPGYLGSTAPVPARMLSPRDEAFLDLAQQAALDQAREVVLTEPLIASLAVVDARELVPPPCVEMAFQLHADSGDAVRRGRFELWLSAAARPSSSMAGRFTDLLPDADREAWATALAGPAGPLPAQLVFGARRRHSENVTRTPRLLEHTIALGWPEGPGLIPFEDLAVTCDDRHLYLMRASTGQLVEPRVLHALEPEVLTPPLARFLAEIAGARRSVWRPVDWGAASRLPFLPRLRYGRTVLAPARWLLNVALLPGPAADRPLWEEAFARWRTGLRLPARVVLVETEMRLPLDLDVPLHRELLRSRLNRAGEVEVREAPAPVRCSAAPSAGGFMGRAHEFLTVLHATGRPAERPAHRAAGVAAAVPEFPGVSRMVCAHLYGHPGRQDEILTEYLPRLLDALVPAPLWWFTRHHDAAHPDRDRHITLVLRLADPDEYGEAAARIGDWAEDLRRLSLAPRLDLAAYQPQNGRYGYGPARDAAEKVFAADTAAALAQITYVARTGMSAEALTAVSLADLAAAHAPTLREGWAWMVEQLPRETRPLDARLSRQVLQMSRPGAVWRREADAEPVLAAWAARADTLAAYRRKLAAQREPLAVLRSLLHLQHVRAMGGGPDPEQTTHRLARTVALQRLHRPKGRP